MLAQPARPQMEALRLCFSGKPLRYTQIWPEGALNILPEVPAAHATFVEIIPRWRRRAADIIPAQHLRIVPDAVPPVPEFPVAFIRQIVAR